VFLKDELWTPRLKTRHETTETLRGDRLTHSVFASLHISLVSFNPN